MQSSYRRPKGCFRSKAKAQTTIPPCGPVLFLNRYIWRMSPRASKSLSICAPQCEQPKKELQRLKVKVNIFSHVQLKVRKGEEWEKKCDWTAAAAAAAGGEGNRWQHKGCFSFCFFIFFFNSINIWTAACIYPHSLFMKPPPQNARGRKVAKQRPEIVPSLLL